MVVYGGMQWVESGPVLGTLGSRWIVVAGYCVLSI